MRESLKLGYSRGNMEENMLHKQYSSYVVLLMFDNTNVTAAIALFWYWSALVAFLQFFLAFCTAWSMALSFPSP